MILRYLLFFTAIAILGTSVSAQNGDLDSVWTPNEKYNVVSPILAELHQLREQLATPGVETREVQQSMSRLYQSAAANANAETRSNDLKRRTVDEQQIQRWAALATNLGRSGLVRGPTTTIADFAEQYNGHWKLKSRLGKGVNTVTSGHIYFNIDPVTGQGETLILEGGTADRQIMDTDSIDYPSMNGAPTPFSIGAFFKTTLVDNNGEISVTSNGEIVGSYNQAFQSGFDTSVTSIYQGYGDGSTMIAEAQSPSNSGIYDEWSQIQLSGGNLIMVSPNLDVIDTYAKVVDDSSSDGKMRVNGVWTLEQYWNFLKDNNALTIPPKR